MPSYCRRFRAGEHERVWSELGALGDVPAALAEDVADVARETMRRVASHVDRIVAALPALGFTAEGDLPVRAPATDADRAELPALAEEIGGLPAALHACLSEVGWVSLLGDCPAVELTYHRDAPAAGMPPSPAFPDPLWLPSASDLREEWDEYRDDSRRTGEPFEIRFPDELHKANVSGGQHAIVLPDRGADPVVSGVAGRPGVTLVSYLRESVRWGGFPGWSFATTAGDVPAALAALRSEPDF